MNANPPMYASLPMYDRPETAAANDRFWRLIRDQLDEAAPAQLTRDIPDLMSHWQSPDLVLSQTCGFPYRAQLAEKVNLVATPVLNLDCAAGHYYSVLIAHRSRAGAALAEFDGATAAYNDPMSQSGWAALHSHMASAGLSLGATLATGAHRASAQAVAEERATVAAIDALTWQMICIWDDFATELCVIDKTAPTPALPYICARSLPASETLRALQQATTALSAADRATLGISGVTLIPSTAYLAVPIPPVPDR
ncbi:phosphonate ABC transporter substrate-binding protein [Litoreibacter halocynthiae]|uniref:Phosphonate ABC transporter substrate-binding protein n=1 Tax=Litoreibacter halocynthiae TaxID=1242689 RepID=A0A4R7LGM5_9RHOB|nr:PhnD/SsuA/transferrin family substrate-binding protein [Litoreibacter halocynthiae]TDT74838.1 phosphonate ABC transporter substrate-binding protein [Litoreibacter halocynthiae]